MKKAIKGMAFILYCIVLLCAGELFLRIYFTNGRLNAIEAKSERPIGECVVYPDANTLHNTFDAPGADRRHDTRIFVFGESSIQGYPYTGNLNIPKWMSLYLRDLYPEKNISVVNCGSSGANSSEWGQLVFDAIDKYRPSVIVIYAGHNNFPGNKPIPPTISRSSGLSRLVSSLYTLRLINMTISGISKKNMENHASRHHIGLETTMDKLNATVMDTFISHIKTFSTEAAKKNIPVVLSTVSSNRSGWPPMISDIDKFCLKPAAGTPHPSCAARDLIAKGDYKHALPIFQKYKDPQKHSSPYEMMSYYEGVCLEHLGNYKAALSSYDEAIRYDTYHQRAIPDLNGRILSLRNTSGVSAVADADAEILKHAIHGIPGFDLFIDGMHPRIQGQKIIAKAFVKSIADNKLVEPVTNWSRLRSDAEYDKIMNIPVNETDRLEISFCFRLIEQSMLSKSLECYLQLSPQRRRITEEAPVPILHILLGHEAQARESFSAFMAKYALKKPSLEETGKAFELLKNNLAREDLFYIRYFPKELKTYPAPDFKSFMERMCGIKLHK